LVNQYPCLYVEIIFF